MAYKRQRVRIVHFNYHALTDVLGCLDIARRIRELKISVISFIDHAPHPRALIEALEMVFKGKKLRPALVFHLYGDFTLHSDRWIKMEPLLKNYRCKFLAASDRQCKLVSRFIEGPGKRVLKVPFPVDRKAFYVDRSLGRRTREKLGIDDATAVFIYSGRISVQKQLLSLVANFLAASKRASRRAVLLVAGWFDNLGVPYMGDFPLPGHYAFQFYQFLCENDPGGAVVKMLGNLEAGELVAYYNAADYYVALSVHNDEDYGMSPIEAMFCGTPSILTDWAGYASFKTEENFSRFVPVSLRAGRTSIDHGRAVALYLQAMENKKRIPRKKISNHYAKLFSIEALSGIFAGILDTRFDKFVSFTRRFYAMNACFKTSPYEPFTSKRNAGRYNAIYEDIYAPYFKEISADP